MSIVLITDMMISATRSSISVRPAWDPRFLRA